MSQQQYESQDDASLKKKRDRFKGMSEDEVLMRMLPDHLVPNLDIVIVSDVLDCRIFCTSVHIFSSNFDETWYIH